MVNVCVQHFNLYKLPKSKLTNANILCLVRFRPEQISAVTDSVLKQRRPDHTITKIHQRCTCGRGSAINTILVYIQPYLRNVSGCDNGRIISYEKFIMKLPSILL